MTATIETSADLSRTSADGQVGKTFPKPDSAGSLGELLRLALPLVASSGSLSLMHVVDRVFLHWYSPDAMAASMSAGIWSWTLLALGVGTASYANAFVAQYEGARRREGVVAILWQGTYFCLAASLVFAVSIPLAGPFFALLGHAAEVQPLEVEYFQIMITGSFPILLAANLACYFSGRGKAMMVLWVNLFGAVVNGVLDYWMIFGGFGLPAMGIRGAAIATVLGNVLMALAYIIAIGKLASAEGHDFLAHWRFDRHLFARLLKFGGPNGLHFGLDVVWFSVFISLVGRLGKDELAASSLAINLNTLAFVPMMGFGTALITIVGQRVGEGRPELAVRSTWLAYALTTTYLTLFAAIFWFAPDRALEPYERFADAAAHGPIRDLTIPLLRFVAIYSLFDAMNIVFSSAIRGAGDTRFAMFFTAAMGFCGLVLPTSAWLGLLGGGLYGCWWIATIYVIVIGLGFLARFQAGQWRSMRVIEPDVIAD